MNSSSSVAIKYGILTTIALIVYFLIVKLLGLHTNPWLRLLNGLFIAYGIYASMKRYKYISGSDFNYINGFKVGLITGFLATFIFALFMVVIGALIGTEGLGQGILESIYDLYQEINKIK